MEVKPPRRELGSHLEAALGLSYCSEIRQKNHQSGTDPTFLQRRCFGVSNGSMKENLLAGLLQMENREDRMRNGRGIPQQSSG